jgi:hypothetical protein
MIRPMPAIILNITLLLLLTIGTRMEKIRFNRKAASSTIMSLLSLKILSFEFLSNYYLHDNLLIFENNPLL